MGLKNTKENNQSESMTPKSKQTRVASLKANLPKPLGPSSRFEPDNDGVDHINILFRKAVTGLGHKLSHFSKITFTHPYLGLFVSMEGFWYFIRSGRIAENMRYLSGFKAKEEGRKFKALWTDHFEEDIMAANYQKIIQNEDLLKEFTASELPFTFYYMDGGDDKKFTKVSARGEEWICRGFEEIRKALKEERVPDCWINAEKRYVDEHESKMKARLKLK